MLLYYGNYFKITVLSDAASCIPVEIDRRFTASIIRVITAIFAAVRI
jgi:hypothetical protein